MLGSPSTASGPFTVSVNTGDALGATIAGSPNLKFLLVAGSSVQVDAIDYGGAGAFDLANAAVVVDGLSGPFAPYFADTTCTGQQSFQTVAPSGPFGGPSMALQALVVDYSAPPYFVHFSSAAEILDPVFTLPGNDRPVADAGEFSFAEPGESTILDGGQSFDPEGSNLSYQWTQLCGPSVTLFNSATVNPVFLTPFDLDDDLVFELIVSDGSLSSLPATVTVAVREVSFQSEVMPIFSALASGNTACTVCHVSAHSSGLDFSTTAFSVWSQLQQPALDSLNLFPAGQLRVDVASAQGSPLLLKPLAVSNGGVAHGGGDLLPTTGDDDYKVIRAWIEQGAQFN